MTKVSNYIEYSQQRWDHSSPFFPSLPSSPLIIIPLVEPAAAKTKLELRDWYWILKINWKITIVHWNPLHANHQAPQLHTVQWWDCTQVKLYIVHCRQCVHSNLSRLLKVSTRKEKRNIWIFTAGLLYQPTPTLPLQKQKKRVTTEKEPRLDWINLFTFVLLFCNDALPYLMSLNCLGVSVFLKFSKKTVNEQACCAGCRRRPCQMNLHQ